MGPRTGECGWQESEAQLSELKTVPMSLVPLGASPVFLATSLE